jgi:hypothetical protein
MHRATLAFPTLALALLAGCGTAEPPAARTIPDGFVPLPGVRTSIGDVEILCAGGGYVERVELHGSTSDPGLTWMTWPDGHRENVVWLRGYSARFDPEREVFDATGLRVAHEGSLAVGGCPMPNGELAEFR